MSDLRRYRLARTIAALSAVMYVVVTWGQPHFNGLNLALAVPMFAAVIVMATSVESHEATIQQGRRAL